MDVDDFILATIITVLITVYLFGSIFVFGLI